MVDFRPIYRQFPPGVRPFATGTGFIQLIFQNYNLSPHPDAKVSWYKGTVRLKDLTGNMQTYPVTYIGSLLNQSFPHLAVVIQDPGFIPAGDKNNLTDIYTVDMTTMKTANFHPGYKLYLTVDNGINPTTGSALLGTDVNFDNTEILPNLTDFNEGNRQTLMAIRSYDIKKDFASFLSNPVVLLAQKISLPMKPNQPKGPLYATRPDFYGKSTYTFDTEFDTKFRRPYSLVFYRSSEDRILDTLYRKSTQAEIWQQLNSLTDPKAKHDPNLWAILFNGANTGSQFSAYVTTAGSFTWLLPDNDGGIGLVLDTDEQILEFNRGAYIYPFESTDKPNEAFKPFACDAVTSRPLFDLSANYIVYGKTISAKDILKKAINSAFLPLNEQPPIFNYFKTGTLTSSVKAKTRDASGNLLDPLKDDLFPMIRILPNTPKKAVVRFTDYTLDGASKSLYFYRVLEMDDKFKFSEASLPVGPVLMVNAFPPDKPQVRKVLTQLQDLRDNKPSAVVFYINAYSENEKITKVEIYRATDETDALSIRTMKKARTIALGTAAFDIVDDFSDVAFPLYGEPLYYRLIAIRDIIDVDGETALPSLPSDVYRGSIVDIVNPKAPLLSFVIGTATATALNNVVLKWAETCYNGTYRLQKLNASGNWVQFHSVTVKTGNMQYPPLDSMNNPDFTYFDKTVSLPKIDDDGRVIYHRFRVQVENSSGLFNLSEFECTLLAN